MRRHQGVHGFFVGVGSFFAGLKLLLSRRRLQLLALAPFVTTIVIFVVLCILAWNHFDGWKDAFFSGRESGFWSWPGVEFLLSLLFWLLLAFASYFSFVVVGGAVAAPFNDLLSQRVEDLLRAEGPPRPRSGGFIRDSARGAGQAILRLGIYVLSIALCLPLLLVPVVGLFGFAGAMTVISIRFLAWDGVDYCLSRRGMSFREKTAFMRAHRSATLGYGTVSFALLSVPFLALFVLPVLAVGGTVLYCRIRSVAGAHG